MNHSKIRELAKDSRYHNLTNVEIAKLHKRRVIQKAIGFLIFMVGAALFISLVIKSVHDIPLNIEKHNNEKAKNEISEVMKNADVVNKQVNIESKNDSVFRDKLNPVGLLNSKSLEVTIANPKSITLTPKHNLVYVVDRNKKGEAVMKSFIQDRNKPYKVKLLDTGAGYILYQYKDYKVNTKSEAFKTQIRRMHEL